MSDTVAKAIIGTYAFGFFATWMIAARYWINQFGDSEAWEGGCWGLLVAIMWPVIVPGYLMGKLVASNKL